jgi:hypothetical protein
LSISEPQPILAAGKDSARFNASEIANPMQGECRKTSLLDFMLSRSLVYLKISLLNF